MAVFPAFQPGHGGFLVLQGIEVFQKQQPRGLLGVVQLAGASGVLVKDVTDVFEGLFEHGRVKAGKRSVLMGFCRHRSPEHWDSLRGRSSGGRRVVR